MSAMNQTSNIPLNGTFQQADSLIRSEIVLGNQDKLDEAINALRKKWTGSDRRLKHGKQRKP